jgi:hypothetical protein
MRKNNKISNRFNAMIAASVVAACGASASAQPNVLFNPDFETTCTFASEWNSFGNVSSINFFTTSGVRAVKMFGPFCCPLGYSGFSQDFPAAPGQTWEASGFATNPTWDALSWNDGGTPDPADDAGSRAFIEIQFLDGSGNVLHPFQAFISDKLSAPTVGAVQQVVAPAVAPPGTVTVRVSGLLEQANFVGGAVWYDDVTLNQVGDSNIVPNSSFEEQPPFCFGSAFSGWVNFGNGQANINQSPRSGVYAAKLFGGFNSAIAASGWYQNAGATPGSIWRASGWATTRADDLLQDNNDVFITLEFFNENGDNISGFETHESPWRSEGVVTGGSNDLMYNFFQTGEAEAPEGTTTVRCLIFQRQVNFAGGATWWDDIELVQVNAVTCFADYNQDGGVDGLDVEEFFIDWSAGNADVNSDGGTDGGDVETFFIQWSNGGC